MFQDFLEVYKDDIIKFKLIKLQKKWKIEKIELMQRFIDPKTKQVDEFYTDLFLFLDKYLLEDDDETML